MDKDYWFWYLIFAIFFLFIMFVAGRTLFVEKNIRGYYLSANEKALSITVDIDNFPDQDISMNGHTLQEVIIAIDSLNKSLPPYK